LAAGAGRAWASIRPVREGTPQPHIGALHSTGYGTRGDAEFGSGGDAGLRETKAMTTVMAKSAHATNYVEFLMSNTIQDNWQMTDSEKIGLAGVLARINPRLSLEIGVFYGGSTSLIAQHSKKLIAIDIDPEVANRFKQPSNVELLIGDSAELISYVLGDVMKHKKPLEFILLDADHSTEGVRRDLNLLLQFTPTTPMVLMMHDTGNPHCRAGVLAADWASNPYVQSVNIDFIPGMIIEHTVASGTPECWGGLGMAFFSPRPREHPLVIGQGAYTSVTTLHRSLESGFWRG
jgi:cephalosporin hydroxylase